ncbi:MAG: GDSL-type esterase/lipase family protein [Ktedonobacteraceae bacterium]
MVTKPNCREEQPTYRHGAMRGAGTLAVLLCSLLIGVVLFSACASGTNSSTGTSSIATTTHSTPVSVVPKIHLPSGPLTYVALGASDAVGVGSDEPATQGYVQVLFKHLPTGSHLLNLGSSGIHLHGALTQELPIALSTSPQLITIWLVANDFVDGVTYNSYMGDLNTLLEQLHAQTHAAIVMANLPDLSKVPFFANSTAAQKTQMRLTIEHWNAGIATLAARYEVTVVDLFGQQSQLTAHPEYISGDGFHPSTLGYAELAKLFWQAIEG